MANAWTPAPPDVQDWLNITGPNIRRNEPPTGADSADSAGVGRDNSKRVGVWAGAGCLSVCLSTGP